MTRLVHITIQLEMGPAAKENSRQMHAKQQ